VKKGFVCDVVEIYQNVLHVKNHTICNPGVVV
jgi:hypothetical protein